MRDDIDGGLDPEGASESGTAPGAGRARSAAGQPLPDELRNWQVLEVDGEATAVAGDDETAARAPATLRIEDQQDEVIVATLEQRHVQVAAGATAAFAITVLNNGPHFAIFQTHIEGWIDERWAAGASPTVGIQPGARATLTPELALPRQSTTAAGAHYLAIVVRAAEYPGRQARLGALLTILPFDALSLELAHFPEQAVTWLQRSIRLPLVVGNQGNRAVAVYMQGSAAQDGCAFSFVGPDHNVRQSMLALQPGQSIALAVRVTVRQMPLFGAQGKSVPIQVSARAGQAPGVLRCVRTTIEARPLFGPWQVVSLTGLAALGALGLVVVAMVALLLAQASRPPTVIQAPVVAPPPVIIVNLDQPAAAPSVTSVPSGVSGQAGLVTGASQFEPRTAPDPALPLVLPDQVTTPGSGGTIRRALAPPAAAATPAAQTARPSAEFTYAQMFQEVGRRYDVDWRMLAAQAYVESGFDSMALSNAGAMGLMQILPDTWREWAQAAGVADPFDSYSNTLVATAYLDHLRSLFAARGYPEPEWMLVAYNWGPDRLGDFLNAGGTWESLPEERRQYTVDILGIAKTIP